MPNASRKARPAKGKTATATAKPAKRPRTVYKSDEVVHRWAHAADAFDIRGDNLTTRHSSDGALFLFSYEMPIAVRFAVGKKVRWLVVDSDETISNTTTRHIWQAFRAVPDQRACFRAPCVIGGGVPALWSLGSAKLSKPDEKTHRFNLAALTARAEENLRKGINCSTANRYSVKSVSDVFAEAEDYRAAFLPKRKPIVAPKASLDLFRKAESAREEKLIARNRAAIEAAKKVWLTIKPDVERALAEAQQGAENRERLRLAAVAEIERRRAGTITTWDAWLAGGERPSHFTIPGRYIARPNSWNRDDAQGWSALVEFYRATPDGTAFDIAIARLIEAKVASVSPRVRYAWGNEVRESSPHLRHLREICSEELPEAVSRFDSLGVESGDTWSEGFRYLLRVGSDGRVESNAGARVPLACVKRAWDKVGALIRKAAAGRFTSEDYIAAKALLPLGVEPYKLESIDSEFVRAGCHAFKPAELVRFADLQGWE